MNRTIIRSGVVAALLVPSALIGASSASATVHVDPCPGQHVQVWSEVGNNGKGQATNHFVCGQVGKDGSDGKDGEQGPKGEPGADSTVPGPAGETGSIGPQGPKGDKGEDGVDGTNGEQGIPGLPGPQGEVGPAGAPGVDGLPGEAGPQGIPGVDGATGPAGPQGEKGEATSSTGARGPAGKDGVTKTVIVHADGTEEVVNSLPKTGGNGDAVAGWLVAGVILIGTGTYIAIRYGKRSV